MYRALPRAVGLCIAVAIGVGVAYVLALRWRSGWLLARASSALRDGNVAAAEATLEKLLARRREDAAALLLLARAAERRGDLAEALTRYLRVPAERWPEAAEALDQLGRWLLEQELVALAERAWREALRRNGRLRSAHAALAYIGLNEYRPGLARQHLLWLCRNRYADHFSMLYLANPRVAGRDAELLKRWLQRDPQNVQLRAAQAFADCEAGEPETALKRCRQLLQEAPDFDHVRAALLWTLVFRKRFEQARKYFPAKRPAGEEAALVWEAMGLVCLELGEYAEAARCLWEAMRLDPSSPTLYVQLSQALQRSGRHAEAAVVAKHARLIYQLTTLLDRMHQSPGQVPMMRQIAKALARLGRFVEARRWLELASGGFLDAEARALLSRSAADSIAQVHPDFDLTRILDLSSLPLPATGKPPGRPTAATGSELEQLPAIRLCDQAAAVGLQFVYCNTYTPRRLVMEAYGAGCAALDYDGDARPDAYFPQAYVWPDNNGRPRCSDRLFRNLAEGRFQDVTAAARIEQTRFGQGPAAGDFDNDGDLDLYVANFERNVLLVNNGDGTFEPAEVGGLTDWDGWSVGAAWADLDRDGNLDLYVLNYVGGPDVLRLSCPGTDGVPRICMPDAYPAEQDRLLLNLGDGRFREVTAEAGVTAPDGKGLGVMVADLDGDMWLDIYVANDRTPNFLFRNCTEPGSSIAFREEGIYAGAALDGSGIAQSGMGIACGDANGDARLDLFVTNFLQEYNNLYLNQSRPGHPFFSDCARQYGLALPSYNMLSFGTRFLDLDLDGWLDLFVTSGHIDDFSAEGLPYRMPAQAFYNLCGRRFVELAGAIEPHRELLGRGAARLDWNCDGRPDLLVGHIGDPAALFTNFSRAGHWLALDLVGRHSNRDAIGATLKVQLGKRSQLLALCSGDGYMASCERRIIVALGTNRAAEGIEVRWPSGQTQKLHNMKAGRHYLLIEGRQPQRRQIPGAPADTADR